VWNKLHGGVFGLRSRFVTHVVNVPAAQIREALACSIGFKCAVVVVHGQRSLCDSDQARARMRVPARLTIGLEGDFGDVEIGIASDPGEEKPSRQVASTHQVEQAVWEIAHGTGAKRFLLLVPHPRFATAGTGVNVPTISASAMSSGRIRILN
jgi:hypothetical protein